MSLRRQEIRHKILDILQAGLDVGGRVFSQRPEPLFKTELPCALVFYNPEQVNDISSNRSQYVRTLSISVDIIQEGRENMALDDELDKLSSQAENLLLIDPHLGLEYVNHIQYAGTVPYNNNTESDHHIGAHRLSFDIQYNTKVETPDLPGQLDEFKRFGEKAVGQIGSGAEIEFTEEIRTD